MFDSINSDVILSSKNFLTAKSASYSFVFEVDYIEEIIPLIEIFNTKNLPDFALGYINLRNENILVFDLTKFFCEENNKVSLSQKILILKYNDTKFAFLIDSFGDISNFALERFSEIPGKTPDNFLLTIDINNEHCFAVNTKSFYEYLKLKVFNIDDNYAQILPDETSFCGKLVSRKNYLTKGNNTELTTDVSFDDKYILFSLSNEFYAFPLPLVKEVKKIKLNALHTIPCSPHSVIGLINYKGDYINVIDIKSFLKLNVSEYPDTLHIIILNIPDFKLALFVDKILEIQAFEISDLKYNNLEYNTVLVAESIYHNKVINILDIEKLFSKDIININDTNDY